MLIYINWFSEVCCYSLGNFLISVNIFYLWYFRNYEIFLDGRKMWRVTY